MTTMTRAFGVVIAAVLIGAGAPAGVATAAAPLPTAIDLGTLGGSHSVAAAVNARGQVVGESAIAGDAEGHPFSWTQTGGMIDLGTLGGTSSFAVAVNAGGLVVGGSTTANDQLHAALWH